LTLKHPLTNKLSFPFDQNQPRSHGTSKSKQKGLGRLAGVRHRQAVQQNLERTRCRLASPCGTGFHRQAVPQRKPENT